MLVIKSNQFLFNWYKMQFHNKRQRNRKRNERGRIESTSSALWSQRIQNSWPYSNKSMLKSTAHTFTYSNGLATTDCIVILVQVLQEPLEKWAVSQKPVLEGHSFQYIEHLIYQAIQLIDKFLPVPHYKMYNRSWNPNGRSRY